MSNFPVGQVVRFQISGKTVFGTVTREAVQTASGSVVKVALLPDFAHLTPTGTTDAGTDTLTAVRVCECAKVAYRGADAKLVTTGCDFTRQPSRTSKFLPGHDAKVKGFLVRAAAQVATLEGGLSPNQAAETFGPKIAAKVSEAITRASQPKPAKARTTATPAVRKPKDATDKDAAPATVLNAWETLPEYAAGDVVKSNTTITYGRKAKVMKGTEAVILAVNPGGTYQVRWDSGQELPTYPYEVDLIRSATALTVVDLSTDDGMDALLALVGQPPA